MSAGTWMCPRHRPGKDVLPGKFGEAVRMPAPLGIEIGTDGFPVYGHPPSRRSPAQKGPFTGKTQ
jgi:hypothetical protein